MAKTIKEIMLEARELIQQKRYDEARSLLESVDHPTATDWLAKLDNIAPGSQAAPAQASRPAVSSAPTPAAKPMEIGSSGTPAVQTKAKNSGSPATGIIVGVLTAIIGGVIVGGLLALSSQLMFLIIASVAIAGLINGALLGAMLKATRVRSTTIAVVLGIIMGVLSYGTFRVAEYFTFRQDFANEMYAFAVDEGGYSSIEEAQADIPPAEMDSILDEVLKEEVGETGIVGFVLLDAREGMTITRARSSSAPTGNEPVVSGALLYGYWFLELLIMAGIPASMAMNQVKAPYCEETGKFLVFKKVGVVADAELNHFLEALRMNNYAEANSYIHDKAKRARTTVTAGRCTEYSPTAMIKVTQQQGRNNKELLNETISGDAFEMLTGASIL